MIRPALTSGEWAGSVVPGEPNVDRDGERLYLYPQLDLLVVGEEAVGGDVLHALAALALHDQPFGFTWEDVDVLRLAAGVEEARQTGKHEVRAANAATFRHLADRIAALLPPREP